MNIKKILDAQNNMSIRAVIFMICQIITAGMGIILAPIFTRILSPEEYGITAVYSTTVLIVTAVIGLQVNATFYNAIAEFQEDEQKKYYSSILFLSFLSFVTLFFTVIIFHQPLGVFLKLDNTLLLLLMPYSFSMFCANFATCYFRAIKGAYGYAAITIGLAILTAGLSIFFVLKINSNKYLGKIFGSAIPYLFFCLIILLVFFKRGKTYYNKIYWRFALSLSLPLIFENVSSLLLAQSDRVMISRIQGDGIAGVYSFCYTLATPINAIWYALNSSWIPQYYEYMKNKDYENLKKRAMGYNFTFTLLTAGYILVCPEAVKILAPQIYWGGINIIPMVVLSYYFIFLYSFPVNHEFYHRKTVFISMATVGTAIVNIGLNFWLIPKYSMIGAAIATLAAYIILFVFHEIVARFIVKGYDYYNIQFYLKGLIPTLIVTALTYLLMEFWMLRWAMGAVVGIFLIVRTVKHRSIY